MPIFEPNDWRFTASQRLQELLSASDLRRFIGSPFEKALRAARREESNKDRPSTVDELADALLIARDTDLLSDFAIREAIAKAYFRKFGQSLEFPKRWMPGLTKAIHFVEQVGLPTPLAGIRSTARPELFTQVIPPADFRELEPYQLEVSEQILAPLSAPAPDNRAIVSLPTGSGKTRVAVQTLHEWSHRLLRDGSATEVVLIWLAHTEELCEQAMACFEDVWRSRPGGQFPVGLLRYWGAYRQQFLSSESQEEMLTATPIKTFVSTPNSFAREDNIFSSLNGSAKTAAIVIDEAHRAGAPTYQGIIQTYADLIPVIGLTATPFAKEYDQKNPHAGTQRLRQLFKHLIEANSLGADPRDRLQEMGILARPRSQSIQTEFGIRVSDLPNEDQDQAVFNFDQQLKNAADQTRRRRVVVRTLLSLLNENPLAQVLYFGPSVVDSETVAFLLNRKGFEAAAVSGETRQSTRRRLINDFKEQRLKVLCNCEVLTTGFDAPRVTHVVIARPTISQVLYEQMVGRGLRGPRFGGTEICHIIDFEDRYRAAKPVLGYQRFREIWIPELDPHSTSVKPEAKESQIGMVIRMGPGEPMRVMKDTDGLAVIKTRPLSRTATLHAQVHLVGPGSGQLRLYVVSTDGSIQLAKTIDLIANEPACTLSIAIATGQRMQFEANTTDPTGSIVVSRVLPST